MTNEGFLTDPYEIAAFIKNAKKVTPVKVYLKGQMDDIDFSGVKVFGDGNSRVVFGENEIIEQLISKYSNEVEDFHIENDRRNSAIPLLDMRNIHARIEPGAVIRDHVSIGQNVVVMMGAVINIGAEIGDGTMVDMNAVVGARGVLGRNVHLGAGAVVAGVLEPPSKTPVIIEDDVLIGANAVILEGVRIGKGAVVGAGSVVTHDVAPNTVVVGSPARVVKDKSQVDDEKTKLLDDLRVI